MSKTDRRFIIAVLILAGFLRLYRLGGQSLFIDEIFTYTVSNPKPGFSIWDYLKYNIHGPLHAFIVYLFNLVSQNDAWLRLPSAIAGIASVYVFYRWIDLWLGLKIAYVSTLLLAIHPLHIHYSQELRNYSFLFLFAVAASFFFHRIIKEDRKRDYIYYAFTLALAALSNFSSAFLYAIHVLIYFLRKGINKPAALRWFLTSIAVLLLISPWMYRIYKVIDVSKLVTPVMPGELTTTERLRGETTVTHSVIPYTCYTFSVGYTLGPSLRELHLEHALSEIITNHAATIVWVGVLFGGLSLFGIRVLARQRKRLVEVLLYLFVPLVLLLALCWQNAKAFNIRYLIVSLPAYLCLLSSAIYAVPKQARIILWVAILATTGWSLGNYYFSDRYAKEDVRGAVEYVRAQMQVEPTDCILVPTVTEVFQHYYAEETPLYTVYAPSGTSKEQVEGQLERLFATCDSFWYVRAREWVDDPDGFLLAILSDRSIPIKTVEFPGVKLIRFLRK